MCRTGVPSWRACWPTRPPGSAPVETERHVTIAGEEDIVVARRLAREAAKGLGFGIVDQRRIATAVSELARRVGRDAPGGQGGARTRPLADASCVGIEVVVSDAGPGIADIAQVMQVELT